MELPIYGIIVIVTGLVALYTSYRGVIYGIVVCSLFGATLALELGGISALPAQVFLGFFALRAFNMVGMKRLGDAFAMDKPGFWLLITCVWGAMGAVVLPRLLSGSTLVFPVDHSMSPGEMALLHPLVPASGNLSQALYCIADVVVYGCMYAFLKYRDAYRTLGNAVFLLTFLNVMAAIVDIASARAGIDVLSYLKTAHFSMLTGEEMGGLVRISGTFPEASAFAGFTLPLFAFCLNLWIVGYRPRLAGPLAIATGTSLLLSTSGTAYASFAGYMIVLLFSRPAFVARSAVARKWRMWAMVACAGGLGILYVTLFLPEIANAVTQFFSLTVGQKAGSGSGIERMSWNMQGITNFLDTYGIGVGLGSIRASSFLVVVVANLGVIGVICYGAFIGKSLLSPVSDHYPITERAICYAARHGMIATLIAASTSASVFELGPLFYLLAASASALSSRAPTSVARQKRWIARAAHE